MNSISKTYKGDIIGLARKYLGIFLYVAILAEMVFFPSWENLAGCAMALIVWIIFRTFFLKRKVILEHPFAFLMFLSMFLYRYLPLIATLIERYPITRGFALPFQTFFYETILFIVSSLAFYFACMKSNNKKNNVIQRVLFKMNFFSANSAMLWALGFVGLAAKIYSIANSNNIEYGDVIGKFLVGIGYLQYAPILLLFPTLTGFIKKSRTNTLVWVYIAVIIIISFATNSRYTMLFPIFTLVLLFFIYLLKNNISIYRYFTPVKIVFFGFFIMFGLNFISDVSLAMLYTRSIRNDVNRTELFAETIEALKDESLMRNLRTVTFDKNTSQISYMEGWDETYINNFMLNRYANMRISDQTLYYAERLGYMNGDMLRNFSDRIMYIFPEPFLRLFDVSFDKIEMEYSRGDLLYALGNGSKNIFAGYRVTSHVGDGLATFGLLYFPIQFVLFFLVFKLLDCFVLNTKQGVVYSVYGLVNIFMFLGMFRNANGCLGEVGYCLRGFWQGIFTYWIIASLFRFFIKSKINLK